MMKRPSTSSRRISPARGKAVRGSRTGRPIMVLLDMLGRRMSLRILWELNTAATPLTFRALSQAADTNPSVLNTRLKELRELGFVEHGEGGYALTESGLSLVAIILPMHRWAEAWAAGREAGRT
jgi:DNA-binding HxlR family transcriptional regulator